MSLSSPSCDLQRAAPDPETNASSMSLEKILGHLPSCVSFLFHARVNRLRRIAKLGRHTWERTKSGGSIPWVMNLKCNEQFMHLH